MIPETDALLDAAEMKEIEADAERYKAARIQSTLRKKQKTAKAIAKEMRNHTIVALCKQGLKTKEIAERCGLSIGIVRGVLNEETPQSDWTEQDEQETSDTFPQHTIAEVARATKCADADIHDAVARWLEKIDGMCHADHGRCSWRKCPQLRDGEPAASGRLCPLMSEEDKALARSGVPINHPRAREA